MSEADVQQGISLHKDAGSSGIYSELGDTSQVVCVVNQKFKKLFFRLFCRKKLSILMNECCRSSICCSFQVAHAFARFLRPS